MSRLRPGFRRWAAAGFCPQMDTDEHGLNRYGLDLHSCEQLKFASPAEVSHPWPGQAPVA